MLQEGNGCFVSFWQRYREEGKAGEYHFYCLFLYLHIFFLSYISMDDFDKKSQELFL